MKRERFIIFLLVPMSLVATGAVLKIAKSVFLPLVIAWLLSFLLAPIVNFLTRRKVPRPLAIFALLVLLFGAGYVAVIFLNGRLAAFIEAFPRYQDKFTAISAELDRVLDQSFNPLTNVDWGQRIMSFLLSLSGSLFNILSKLIMVVIFLIFMLSGQTYFPLKVKKALSSENADRVTDILSSISSQITRYLSAQCLISFATGVLVWGVLALIGLDFPITWGALAFLLNFIPTVGSIVASIPPILLALVQFYPEIWPALLTLVCVLTIQMVIGNGIAPKVMGDTLNLSPVVVLVSLMFWGWLWGVAGALMSIPITAALRIACEHVDELRPLAVLLSSGRAFRKK